MLKKLSTICICLMVILNIVLVAFLFFKPTSGFSKTTTLKWTTETENFVENKFGKYDNDLDKVNAMRQWIIENVKYTPYDIPFIQTVDVDKVIETGQGICFEQASLFTVFCRISGIECYNVDGRAKSNYSLTHSWNRFCIDGTWYETDITHDQTALSRDLQLYGVKEINALNAPDKTYNIYRTY